MINDAIWSQVLENSLEISKFLIEKEICIACAESCTGGLIASAFTSIPGSSVWFDHGVVSYSNQSKIDILGVSTQTIDSFGAVSEQTAAQMSNGLLLLAPNVGIAVSTTGIAGPGGAVPGKPVGTVCFGVSYRKDNSIVSNTYTKYFDGDRDQIRKKAVLFVTKLLQALEE